MLESENHFWVHIIERIKAHQIPSPLVYKSQGAWKIALDVCEPSWCWGAFSVQGFGLRSRERQSANENIICSVASALWAGALECFSQFCCRKMLIEFRSVQDAASVSLTSYSCKDTWKMEVKGYDPWHLSQRKSFFTLIALGWSLRSKSILEPFLVSKVCNIVHFQSSCST